MAKRATPQPAPVTSQPNPWHTLRDAAQAYVSTHGQGRPAGAEWAALCQALDAVKDA